VEKRTAFVVPLGTFTIMNLGIFFLLFVIFGTWSLRRSIFFWILVLAVGIHFGFIKVDLDGGVEETTA